MRARTLLSPRFIIGVLAAIVVLHFLATYFRWYEPSPVSAGGWRIDWMFHAVGGFWIAGLFFYASYRGANVAAPSSHPLYIGVCALGAVALAGVLWEFFEFWIDATFGALPHVTRQQGGLHDTMFDLAFDLAGGAVGTLLYLVALQRR